MAEQQASEGPKWFEVLPQPRSEPSGISDEETAELIKTKVIGQDYVIVDVRRTDFEVIKTVLFDLGFVLTKDSFSRIMRFEEL